MELVMEKVATRARVRVGHVPGCTMSAAEQEMRDIDALAKRIASSKKESVDFLRRAGIINSRGALAKAYR